MAIYVPPSRRRRRLVLTGLACLVIGVVAGLLVGRASVTTTSERISRVRTEADDIATRIEALTIEYEQALSGQGDSVQGGVLDALDGIDRDLAATLAIASWLSPSSRARLVAAVRDVREAATEQVSASAFADQTAAAATTIRAELGVPGG
jgi:hypothetical protein